MPVGIFVNGEQNSRARLAILPPTNNAGIAGRQSLAWPSNIATSAPFVVFMLAAKKNERTTSSACLSDYLHSEGLGNCFSTHTGVGSISFNLPALPGSYRFVECRESKMNRATIIGGRRFWLRSSDPFCVVLCRCVCAPPRQQIARSDSLFFFIIFASTWLRRHEA